MASIIPGYEYDIFISYRQKDNKHDGWVTEFVENLKGELESTFKEAVSVYFDINSYDGLLETHDVYESLNGKLRCLVFIPIISRTYCDTRSFAWEYELKAFVEQASMDQFGLKVRLANGNITSRVLPVRIHDLDPGDVSLLEGVLGSSLRTLDFVFKTVAGVNRPLKSKEDHPVDNLNKNYYKDQINKVALAINEIILALKTRYSGIDTGKAQHLTFLQKAEQMSISGARWSRDKLTNIKFSLAVLIIMILVIAEIIFYPRIFKRDRLAYLKASDGKISIAVIPFQNMTNDTTWNVWQEGIQINLATSLANENDLKVRPIESINGILKSKGFTTYGSLTPSVASSISQKLDASILILGSINEVHSTVRVNAQLIDSNTSELLKSFQINGIPDSILKIVDSLSRMVASYLIISKLESEFSPADKYYANTNSPEAYRFFMYGQKSLGVLDVSTAKDWYYQAIAQDSNFVTAELQIAQVYAFENNYAEAKRWCLNAYKKREHMTIQDKLLTNIMHAYLFENTYEELKYLKLMVKIEDQMPLYRTLLGRAYSDLNQYEMAIPEFEKTLDMFHKMGSKPAWSYNYIELGYAYHKTGNYAREKEIYKKAEHDFPDDPEILGRQIILALTEGDMIAAKKYIKKYFSSVKDRETKLRNLVSFYSEAGMLDEAKRYLHQLLDSGIKNPEILNGLAPLMIENGWDLDLGLELIDKELEITPDDYNLLDTKGWGLYKLGKYQEAGDILQRSWDLRLKNAIYSHTAFLHLEEVRKILATKN